MNSIIIWGIALLLAIAAVIFGLDKWEGHIRESGRAEVRAEWAKATAKAEAEQRTIEQNRAKALQEAQNAHQIEVAKARADASKSSAAVASLRQQLASLSQSGSNPAAPEGSKTSTEIGTLLGNCAEEYQAMGVLAEQAYLAGQLCEQSYKALN